jgi:hypothetical protein
LFPNINSEKMYVNFALKHKMLHWSLSPKADLGKGVGNSSNVGQSGLMFARDAEQDEEQGKQLAEMAQLVASHEGMSGGTFRRWIKTLISYLSAKCALESHSTRKLKDKDILIQALGMKRSKPAPMSHTMMMDLIHELTNDMDKGVNAGSYEGIRINSPPMQFNNAIDDMKSHIISYQAAKNKFLYNKIYEEFELLMNDGADDDNKLQDLALFNCTQHSEALLAAATICGQEGHVSDNEQLLEVIQACCPSTSFTPPD